MIDASSCPFDLSCSLQETDDRIPSFRFAIRLAIPHFDGEFRYHAANVWFSCTQFDQFVDALNEIAAANDGEATLSDLSDEFSVKMANADGEYSAHFSIRQRDANYPNSTLSAECPMDREAVQLVLSQFKGMPRWW